MKEFLKKLRPGKGTIIVASIILLLLIVAAIYDRVRFNQRIILPDSHIFVCDNSEQYSEFDHWLFDDLEIDRVPMYVVIYNNHVIGLINGNIPEEPFTEELGTILAVGKECSELPEFKIENILDDKMSLIDIANQHSLVILEISWATCDDCNEQDEHFTNAIYYKYSTDQIYRYYVKSTKQEVLKKHK